MVAVTKLSRSALALLALAGAIPLVVAGCGPSAIAEGAAPSSPVPVRGGELRLMHDIGPASLDPADAGSIYESLPVHQIFDGLVAIDAGMNLRPVLAETWTLSLDGLTYTFDLRPNVRFHDGEMLDADDVVYTLRRLLAPGRVGMNIASPYLLAIAGARDYAAGRTPELPGVTALGPLKLSIRLEQRSPYFLQALSLDNARVVPRHVVEAVGDEMFGRAPVGTGPFRLVSWCSESLVLGRNEDYFAGAPYLDGVRIDFARAYKPGTSVERFREGQLDLIAPSPKNFASLAASPEAVVVRAPGLNTHFLGLSTVIAPLDDPLVRQAIAHAIDREAVARSRPDGPVAARGIFPPGMPGYSPELRALAYDPERARELLAAAGYADGHGLPSLPLYGAGTGEPSPIADRICQDLERVGVHVDWRPQTWETLGRLLAADGAPLYLLGWAADLNDEDPFLRSLFVRGGVGNHSGFDDAQVSAWLDRAATEPNPIERTRLYRAAERRVLELAPIVPLYHAGGTVVARSRVRGMHFGTLGLASLDLDHVWLAAEAGVEGTR